MIKFRDDEHKKEFVSLLHRMKGDSGDVYRMTLAYLITADRVCSEHIENMYDFDERRIIPGCLNEGWQTGTSVKTTLLAFNLFTGHMDWCDDDRSLITPAEIFCCEMAPYFWEAIKLRYPEYTAK